MCTDKIEVRKYVAKKGLSSILIPVLGEGYRSFDEIDFEKLPKSFVIKASHGCKMNYVVTNKSKLDKEKCEITIQNWLNTTYGTYSVEPHYKDIPHRIYIEEYLGEADKLVDYKFHCMNGIPRFVLTCSNRHSNGDRAMQVTRHLYDMEWNQLNGIVGNEENSYIEKPLHFEEMKEIATILSKDFKFVRVDLYEVEGKIYFGELTFTPAHCVFAHFTDEFIQNMGKYLDI